MADPILQLWNEIEAAEAKIGSGPNASSKAKRHALERVRRSVRAGGMAAGDKHSIARFRTQVRKIAEGVTDATFPSTTITSAPSGTITVDTATVEFSSDDSDASFQVKLDGGAYGAPSGPGNKHVMSGLSEASHTVLVRAVDSAGNTDQTPASVTFTVDLP